MRIQIRRSPYVKAGSFYITNYPCVSGTFFDFKTKEFVNILHKDYDTGRLEDTAYKSYRGAIRIIKDKFGKDTIIVQNGKIFHY